MQDYTEALRELQRKEEAARRKRRRRPVEQPSPPIWKRVMMTIALAMLCALGYAVKKKVDEPESHTARCRDGTYSDSRHRSGTCSGHLGVKAWINLPED